MNEFSRSELMDMFAYCFQIMEAVEDLEEAIEKRKRVAKPNVIKLNI